MNNRNRIVAIVAPVVAIAVSFILFSTCQKDGKTAKINHSSDADAVGLTGTWSSGCNADSSKKNYYSDDRNFDADIFQTTYTSFADANCTSKILTQKQTGSFKIQPPEDGVTGTPIDLTTGTVSITAHTNAVVQSYNDKKFCGGGWELNVEKVITRELCVQGAGSSSEPDVVYETFSIDGKTIHFGAKDTNHNGKTPETRPTSVDSSRSYVRN